MIAAPPVAIAVSPPRIVVAAGAARQVFVTNTGATPVTVAGAAYGFGVGLRGRPRILLRSRRVVLAPRRLTVTPGETRAVRVTARALPSEPGDHPALVLLTGHGARRGVGVDLRVGVVVLLRTPGRVVHRLVAGTLRPVRGGLELTLRNAGNVSEQLSGELVHVRLLQRGRVVARPQPVGRELLPHTRGICVLRYRAHVRGAVTAVVAIGTATWRFRLRLP